MTTEKQDPSRAAFEVWLNNPHYDYTDSNKAMMFDAWQASREQALEEAAQACIEQQQEPECPERAAYCAEAIRSLK